MAVPRRNETEFSRFEPCLGGSPRDRLAISTSKFWKKLFMIGGREPPCIFRVPYTGGNSNSALCYFAQHFFFFTPYSGIRLLFWCFGLDRDGVSDFWQSDVPDPRGISYNLQITISKNMFVRLWLVAAIDSASRYHCNSNSAIVWWCPRTRTSAAFLHFWSWVSRYLLGQCSTKKQPNDQLW